MLTCIACSKQVEAGEDTERGNPNNRDAVKSLTSQIKDMVLKLSGVYRQCKPGGPSSSSSYRKGGAYHRYMGGFEDASEAGASSDGGGTYQYHPYVAGKGGSSSSTPAWDFTARTRGPPAAGGLGADKNKFNRYEAWIPGAGVPVVESVDSGCRDPPREEDKDPKEWIAQVEPGVDITFLSLPQGGNDLKRIRFSREMFNKWQAQRWWGENYDRIMELYNVQKFNRQALSTPPRSEDEREPALSHVGSTTESPLAPVLCRDGRPHGTPENRDPDDGNTTNRTLTASSSSGAARRGMNSAATALDPIEQFFPHCHHNPHHPDGRGSDLVNGEAAAIDASRTTTSSGDEASVSASNASDAEVTEWVEQDEPGVYITIRQLGDGSKELRRVRFSREQFGETHAKLWWEENRERIHSQYL